MFFMTNCNVFVCCQPVDMRKSYEGLSALTCEILKQDPLSGHLFVFTNKKQDRLKILYWHLNGYCLWQKRLEKGRFYIPQKTCESSISLTLYQLSGLFQGIAWDKIPLPKTLSYKFT